MGVMTEQNILGQAKKGQGETNERLDLILAEMRTMNRWLAHVSAKLDAAGVTTPS